MRARLLDLGDVGDVRSQAVYHALAATMEPGDDPAIVLLRPTGPYVSIGCSQDLAAIDLEHCRESDLPVIRRHTGGGILLIDPNHLLFQLVLPAARAGEMDLSRATRDAYRRLGIDPSTRPLDDVEIAGHRIGGAGGGEIGYAVCFAASMAFDLDHARLARVLRLEDETARAAAAAALETRLVTLWRLLDPPPDLPVVAEALVAACESCFGFEPVPSLPTPDELEAVYLWERRLLSDPWLHRPAPSAATRAASSAVC